MAALVGLIASPFIWPMLTGAIAGAAGGATTAGLSGTDAGTGALWGAAFGLGTGMLGEGVAGVFKNVGRRIFDSGVVIASGITAYQQNGVEGFWGGVFGSGLVTGISSGFNYGEASNLAEAPTPRGFWETFWDIASFGYSLKQFNDNPSWMTGLGLIADTVALLAPGVPGGAGAVSKATGGLKKGGTEVVERWMSRAELRATEKTGLLRGGREGTHFVTNSANSNALRARQRLALDYTPEVRVRMGVPEGIFSAPTKVYGKYGMSGGGMERKATGQIAVKILEAYE